MLISKDHLLKLIAQLKFEHALNIIVSIIIVVIIFFAVFIVLIPIESNKYHQVEVLSEQATYPATQKMARKLLIQEQIKFAEYFRLMRAHQFESSKVKQYPAMEQE